MAEAHSDSSDEEPTIAEDIVVTKYNMAGEMANSKTVCKCGGRAIFEVFFGIWMIEMVLFVELLHLVT